jgi:hypothetical protein
MELAPVDVLSAIFVYVEDSDDVLRMFLTGSIKVRFKLIHAVKKISGIFYQIFNSFLFLSELDLSLDENLTTKIYPQNLTKLILVENFFIEDQHCANFPKQLTHLNVSKCRNIKNLIANPKLEHLNVSSCPELRSLLWIENLEHLDVSYCRKLIMLSIPKNLLYLNVTMSGVLKSNMLSLPQSLVTLIAFDYSFSASQIENFPPDLKKVQIGLDLLKADNLVLPRNVIHLNLREYYSDDKCKIIYPENIVCLTLDNMHELTKLPSTLTSLSIENIKNASVSFEKNLSEAVKQLSNLKKFSMRQRYGNLSLLEPICFEFPESLIELNFRAVVTNIISYKLPQSVTYLETNSVLCLENKPYNNLKNLRCMRISSNFIKCVPNLESLTIKQEGYQTPIKIIDLPRSLIDLDLPYERAVNQEEHGDFPPNLLKLKMCCVFEEKPSFLSLPKSLLELKLNFINSGSTSFCFSAERDCNSQQRGSTYNLGLEHLNLETLHIFGHKLPKIRNLPTTLKHFTYLGYIDIFPPKLVTFTGKLNTVFDPISRKTIINDILPQTMKRVTTSYQYGSMSAPKNLPHLVVRYY